MSVFFESLVDRRIKDDVLATIDLLPTNYIGNKRRILPQLSAFLEEENVEFNSIFDAFSGSGLVSWYFACLGKDVIVNDLLGANAVTAYVLLQAPDIPVSFEEMSNLLQVMPNDAVPFVNTHFPSKHFTSNECVFLDQYREVCLENLDFKGFCFAMELMQKALLYSIPNSNFSVTGKDLMALRSMHQPGRAFHEEKWRDTTRKRRDENNEIMFSAALCEMYNRYVNAFNFLGTTDVSIQKTSALYHYDGDRFLDFLSVIGKSGEGDRGKVNSKYANIFASDVHDLLALGEIQTDVIYFDPPYGGSSSDYLRLYGFLDAYLYGKPIDQLPHLTTGNKRFSKKKGYQEEFLDLLQLSSSFPVWMFSFNESSFASLDEILELVKEGGRTDIRVKEIPITYQFRRRKKQKKRGTEYLILARP